MSKHFAIAIAVLGMVAMLAGSWFAHVVQTQDGYINITDVRFTGASGHGMSGLLYLPAGASEADKVPGILAIHGYINSRETQSSFAIELARRGYAVLALDQTGHGFSAPPAFANGFGGPDGLAWLRTLEQVDPDNIGLLGHSMGGWAVLSAAAALPDGYQSMALLGSTPGLFGAPEADERFPRNLAVVFSAYDEFSELMWQVPTGRAIIGAPRLASIFATESPVVPGKIYGDVAAGSARLLHVPPVTHPGDHLSSTVAALVADWFGRTLTGSVPRQPDDQSWVWKEAATALALVGLVLFLPAAAVVGAQRLPGADVVPISRWRMLPALLIPVISYFPCFLAAEVLLPVNAVWPQPISNGLMLWLLVNAAVNIAFAWRHRAALVPNAKDFRPILRAALPLVLGYGTLVLVHSIWVVDWRWWVVAAKPFAPWHWSALFAYLPVLLLGFASIGLALHVGLTHDARRPATMVMRNVALLAGPFALLLCVQYGGLFAGFSLPLGQPLMTIVALQFVLVLVFVAVNSTVLFQTWRRIWPGAVLNAGFVGWLVVAGTATSA